MFFLCYSFRPAWFYVGRRLTDLYHLAAMSTSTETVRPRSALRSSPSPFSLAASGMLASRARNRARNNDARESWAGEIPRTNVSIFFIALIFI